MARQAEKGEKCIVNTDCLIGKCVKGSCKVEKAGQPCDYDENCDEISICSADGEQCASMKALGDPCSYSTDCKIGLECAGLEEIAMVCIKIATAPSGYIAGTELACQTGYTITNENGLLICVNFKKTKSCEKKADDKYYCTGTLEKGEETLFNNYELQCVIGWDDEYICPSDVASKFTQYIEYFSIENALLSESKNNRITNRYTLNLPSLAEYYLDYKFYDKVHDADPCIRNFYFQEVISAKFLSVSFVFVLSFFLYC